MRKKGMRLKRICFLCSLTCMLCFLAGCGDGEDKLKAAEERVIQTKQDARDAVSEMNEKTNQINQMGDAVEQE